MCEHRQKTFSLSFLSMWLFTFLFLWTRLNSVHKQKQTLLYAGAAEIKVSRKNTSLTQTASIKHCYIQSKTQYMKYIDIYRTCRGVKHYKLANINFCYQTRNIFFLTPNTQNVFWQLLTQWLTLNWLFSQPLIRLNLSCHSPANSSQKTLRTRRADSGF